MDQSPDAMMHLLFSIKWKSPKWRTHPNLESESEYIRVRIFSNPNLTEPESERVRTFSNPNLFESKFDRIRIWANPNLDEPEYSGSVHTYSLSSSFFFSHYTFFSPLSEEHPPFLQLIELDPSHTWAIFFPFTAHFFLAQSFSSCDTCEQDDRTVAWEILTCSLLASFISGQLLPHSLSRPLFRKWKNSSIKWQSLWKIEVNNPSFNDLTVSSQHLLRLFAVLSVHLFISVLRVHYFTLSAASLSVLPRTQLQKAFSLNAGARTLWYSPPQ